MLSAGPVCSCAHFFVHIAHETAGAARTRSSLRPLTMERDKRSPTTRALRAARSRIHVPCSFKNGDAANRRCKYRKKKPGRNGRAFLLSKCQIANELVRGR